MSKTFAEKLFSLKSGEDAYAGDIVFAEPDLVLSHDNSASIMKTWQKMGGKEIKYPDRLVIVLDHDSPPTSAKLANDHQIIRDLVKDQGITNFYDEGTGICHQLMSNHALPDMLIVGSDSHTCTSGTFDAFAAGIDRTETAGLWLTGETWFRVPETIKITLKGKLQHGVYAKDIALYLMNQIGASGSTYNSIEFHGEGVKTLGISERMTLANLASEMGAKNAVFPPDEVLIEWLKDKHGDALDIPKEDMLWADEGATYIKELTVELDKLEPLIAVPHQVDNIDFARKLGDVNIHQAFLGTCTNARLDDLAIAAELLEGKTIHSGMIFLVAPASRAIYLESQEKGYIQTLTRAGATILTCSCGPCLGKGQGIPYDGANVISTANRNFLGRMGNKNAFVYLASPATVAISALTGKITDPRQYISSAEVKETGIELRQKEEFVTVEIEASDDRYKNNVWNYSDVNDFNTDQMFAGTLTYDIKSSDGEKIVEHLFKGLDETFAARVSKGDIIVAGENFGCGSSREHPSVGLAFAEVKAVIVKSVSRIFYRSAINQGLPIIVHPDFVENLNHDAPIEIYLKEGTIVNGENNYSFSKLPKDLLKIFEAGGLINYYQEQYLTPEEN